MTADGASVGGVDVSAADVTPRAAATLPFAVTIFLGAFLLFQLQPLIGKYVLPWFGGAPAVWTTCMLFFQTLLLGGYAYVHLTTRMLSPRSQAVLHVALLIAALCVLPIYPSPRWKPAAGEDPTLRILILLTACVGLPYFVLSATGPLLQAWVARISPGRQPYRLYALSNVGSFLALLTYPFVVEPMMTRRSAALLWSITLVVFVVACAYCAVRALAPSPGNPGEGWGGGALGISDLKSQGRPHPSPRPAYRERGTR